jgi:hypothetical protein
MLINFIRFSSVDYCIEGQTEPIVLEETEYCGEHYETKMIGKAGDVIAFIIDKSEVETFIDAIHLSVALTSNGILTELDIATVADSEAQYYITATLPIDLIDGEYEITILKNYVMQVISFTPETSLNACDATFTVEVVDAPAINFEFSINQIDWISDGVFAELCMEEYTIYVREEGDETCIYGTLDFNASPLDCGEYEGFTLQQVIDTGKFLSQFYNCTLDDLKP